MGFAIMTALYAANVAIWVSFVVRGWNKINTYTDKNSAVLCLTHLCITFRFKPVGREDSDSGTPGSESGQPPTQQHQHHQFLGDASCAIPDFGSVEIVHPLPEGITVTDIRTFEQLYIEHSEAILDVVVNLQFSLIEALWQSFWRTAPADQQT